MIALENLFFSTTFFAETRLVESFRDSFLQCFFEEKYSKRCYFEFLQKENLL